MEEPKISDEVYEQIKDLRDPYVRGFFTKENELLVDKLILNEELKERYKKYGLCSRCKQPFFDLIKWCQPCNRRSLQEDFKNWTSGNRVIDEFIQNVQLETKTYSDILEWIEYNSLKDVEYIARGGFGTVYKAIRKKGEIISWDSKVNGYFRRNNSRVVLKYLDNTQDNITEFLREVELHHSVRNNKVIACFGITKNPETNEFAIVIEHAFHGSLRQHLDKNFSTLGWIDRFDILFGMTNGLEAIHNKGLVHHDFHSGNLLVVTNSQTYVSDLGLCRPINVQDEKTYGVLPYVAPEVLRGKEYTQKSDIYALGIIMYEVFTGLPPYYNIPHDGTLAIKICQGLRPTSNYKIPQLILDIIKQCWDPDPLKRPSTEEIIDPLCDYKQEYIDLENRDTAFCIQAKEADEFNKQLPPLTTSLPDTDNTDAISYTTHPQAVYTSRLLDFKDLPESNLIDFNIDIDLEDENN